MSARDEYPWIDARANGEPSPYSELDAVAECLGVLDEIDRLRGQIRRESDRRADEAELRGMAGR